MISGSSLVTFYREGSTTYRIDIRDLDSSGPDYYALVRFSYESDIEADQGSLVAQENAILIAPHNKMLTLIDGVWRLNDFVSTTPVLSSSNLNVDNPPPFDEVNTTLQEGKKAKGSITCTSGATSDGSLLLVVAGISFTVSNIKNGDSTGEVASKISTALNGPANDGSNFSVTSGGKYSILLSGSVVEITYQEVGVYTEPINVQTIETGATFIYTIAFSGGVDPVYGGGNRGTIIPRLKQIEDYAYKARYVYLDGHKTATCFPLYLKTTNFRRFNALDITTAVDLDGNACDIEIFRKTGSDEFQLIEILRNPQLGANGLIEFIDDGKPSIQPLDERQYVWTSKHKTHAVLRDRYVRANLSYPDREVVVSGLVDVRSPSTGTLSEGDNIAPSNASVELYARGRAEDGLMTFHHFIGNVNITDNDSELFVTQSNTPDVKELAFYARYKGLAPEILTTFNTPEIYNANIESIATNDTDAKDKPANPHILLGWRYITGIRGTSGGQSFISFYIFDKDWQTKPNSTESRNRDRMFVSSIPGTLFPEKFTFNTFNTPITYFKKFQDPFGDNEDSVVYEMEIFDGLLEAVAKQKLKLVLNQLPFSYDGGNLSSSLKNSEILNIVVDVVGIVDKSRNIRLLGSGSNLKNPYSPENSRVYLVVDSDSVYSKIDNRGIIRYKDYKRDYNTTSAVEGFFPGSGESSFSFSILGAVSEVVVQGSNSPGTYYTTFPNNTFLFDRSGTADIESLIYLGTSNTKTKTKLRTGFKKTTVNNFITYELLENNVYETLLTRDTLGYLQEDYPNQVLWSEPLVVGTRNSGNRTFGFSSFLNMSQEYGEIVKVEPSANRLLIFCKRGVAVCLVGETFAESPSGGTFVNSSAFLSSPVWILRSVPEIQPNSIVSFENMIFFCDGNDVWMFSDQLQNISQGAVTLSGSQVGSIDPKNKEYRISGGGKTYAYSIESQQWFGPHTYTDDASCIYSERMLSVVDGSVVEHNKTNLFGGVDFDTIVESVANDLDEPSVDKTFRKFYIEHVGGDEFSYGKNKADLTTKNLEESAKKQDITHIGVNPQNSPARQIFWRIKSSTQGFVLKMISFVWNSRMRR